MSGQRDFVDCRTERAFPRIDIERLIRIDAAIEQNRDLALTGKSPKYRTQRNALPVSGNWPLERGREASLGSIAGRQRLGKNRRTGTPDHCGSQNQAENRAQKFGSAGPWAIATIHAGILVKGDCSGDFSGRIAHSETPRSALQSMLAWWSIWFPHRLSESISERRTR